MSFFESKENTHEQVGLIHLVELLFSFCHSEDKQKADSPCEEIRISAKIENDAKAYKAFRSQTCKAFPKRFVSFTKRSISCKPFSVSVV